MLGVSPRPFTTLFFSVSAICRGRLGWVWKSSTFLAMSSPLALYQGPGLSGRVLRTEDGYRTDGDERAGDQNGQLVAGLHLILL